MAAAWNCKSVLNSWAISLTTLLNGAFQMSNSGDFWYLLILTVPLCLVNIYEAFSQG